MKTDSIAKNKNILDVNEVTITVFSI